MTAASLLCTADGCDKRAMRTVADARYCMFHPYSEPPEFDEKGKLIGKATPLKPVTTRLGGGHTYARPVEVPKRLLRDCCSTPVGTDHHPSCPHLTLAEELDVLEVHDPAVKAAAEGLADAIDRLGTPAEVAAIEAGDLVALRPEMLVSLVQEVTSCPDCATTDTAAPAEARVQVVHVPPPHVETALTTLEEHLEQLLDEVATVRALTREVRIAYATPPLDSPTAPEPPKKRRQISPEGRERMRESGRRLGELNRQRAAARATAGAQAAR